MMRFAAVKLQRTVALAKDMNAAADEIVKLRNHARRNKRDPPSCAPTGCASERSSGCTKPCGFTTSLAGDRIAVARAWLDSLADPTRSG